MPKKNNPGLTPEDKKLWEHFQKQITPLGSANAVTGAVSAPLPPLSDYTYVTPPTPRAKALPELVENNPAGLDMRSFERLRKGQLPIEARLDLHGKTHAQAFPVLKRFILKAAALEKRCVLIITGKGQRSERPETTLKIALPGWLNHPEIRPFIISFHIASPGDGGSGAYYLLLRRNRA